MNSKRKALQKIAGIGTFSIVMHGSWIKPVVNSVVLPAHAQTSPSPNPQSITIPDISLNCGDSVFREEIVLRFSLSGDQVEQVPFTGNLDNEDIEIIREVLDSGVLAIAVTSFEAEDTTNGSVDCSETGQSQIVEFSYILRLGATRRTVSGFRYFNARLVLTDTSITLTDIVVGPTELYPI